MRFNPRPTLLSLLCAGSLLPPCVYSGEIAASCDVDDPSSSPVATPGTGSLDPQAAADERVLHLARDDSAQDPAKADTEIGSGRTVDESVLAAARGGAEHSVSENNLDAVLENNSASNLSTGNNSVSDGAFSNSTGLPMVIQNSGNNVIIQNSTILNLDLH